MLGPYDVEPERYSKLKTPEKTLLSNLLVIKGETLIKWGRFRIFEEIKDQLVKLPIEKGVFPFFISHRWETNELPDPNNYQYEIIQQAIEMSPQGKDSFYWYDYSCMPQKQNSHKNDQNIKYILQNLNKIVKNSKLIAIRRSFDDYFSRGWCFHEWFTAQFTGKFDRLFIGIKQDASYKSEINLAKRLSDRIICGEFFLLDDLLFSKNEDREIVKNLTKKAAINCQNKISESCLEVIKHTIMHDTYSFPNGLRLTSNDIYQRFSRLKNFIKVCSLVLQPIEPVTDRVAMFFQKKHWDALIKTSQPIATHLTRLEYKIELRDEEVSPEEKELRNIYDYCQRKLPEAQYSVTAFLCFYLMGYKV